MSDVLIELIEFANFGSQNSPNVLLFVIIIIIIDSIVVVVEVVGSMILGLLLESIH